MNYKISFNWMLRPVRLVNREIKNTTAKCTINISKQTTFFLLEDYVTRSG